MLEETEVSSAKIMERMEATLGNLEQMSYDTINTTDQLVTCWVRRESTICRCVTEQKLRERKPANRWALCWTGF